MERGTQILVSAPWTENHSGFSTWRTENCISRCAHIDSDRWTETFQDLGQWHTRINLYLEKKKSNTPLNVSVLFSTTERDTLILVSAPRTEELQQFSNARTRRSMVGCNDGFRWIDG